MITMIQLNPTESVTHTLLNKLGKSFPLILSILAQNMLAL